MNETDKQLTEEEISQILQKVGPLASPPEDMTDRVRSAVKATWQEEVSTKPQTPWLRYAAGIAVVAGSLYLGLNQTSDVAPVMVAALDSNLTSVEISTDGSNWYPPDQSTLAEDTYVRSTAPASLSFNNSMNVRINATTELKIVDDNTVQLITGDLYLDSYSKPAEEPFLVKTPFGTATDIGTQFMVSTYTDGWSVQVREGLVNVGNQALDVSVTPGNKISISRDNAIEETTLPNHDQSWQWAEKTRPAFDIDGKKLNEYLAWVARETGKELRYHPDVAFSARQEKVHGSIEHLSASDSLAFVLPTTDLQLIESDAGVIFVGVAGDL